MKIDTKTRIIEAGSEIIHLKGFNNTGLQEILDAAGVPKGSFYNYFKSKEDFGLEVVDYFVNYFNQLAKSVFEDSSIASLEKIRVILDSFIEFFKSKDFAYGCPIGNLAQEMGDLSPKFRQKLKDALDSMVGWYCKALQEAKDAGQLGENTDVKETAYFIVSSWHGALVHMKIEKSPSSLENHRRFIFDYILKS